MTDYQNYPGAPSSAQQYADEVERRAAANNAQAQMSAQQKEHDLEVGAIVSQGRDTYGKEEFDDASDTVAKAFGDRTPALVYALRGFDTPGAIIMELAKRGEQG